MEATTTTTTTHDSLSSSGLEWENLALYSNKPNNMQMNVDLDLDHQQQFGIPNDLCEGSTNSSSRDFGKLGYEDMQMMRTMQQQQQQGDHHPMSIGLRLGHLHNEYEYEYASTFPRARPNSTSLPLSSTPSSTPTPTPTKRSRASYHNMQNPCCQVEGCNLDLKLAKDYHRRHRICESHSKSPKVVVAGMERRFCQQCSRFHDLSEFDDKKRSCRRRLSDHNARRRRVQPESIHLSSPAGISSALYTTTDHRQQNVLLNGLPVSMPNSSCWENGMPRHGQLVRPSKTLLNDDILHIDTDTRLTSLHRSTPPRNINLDQCGVSNSSSMGPELMGAHSFLSSNSWSLHEGESTSMEGISYSPVMRHHSETTTDHSQSHNLTLFQNTINGLDHQQPPPSSSSSSPSFLHSVNMQNVNAAASPHQQEYQLFKPPNYQYSGNTFYSSQRST